MEKYMPHQLRIQQEHKVLGGKHVTNPWEVSIDESESDM
jgi:hypothetical protein